MDQGTEDPALSKPIALARSRSRYKGSRPNSTPILHRSKPRPHGIDFNHGSDNLHVADDVSNLRAPSMDAASTFGKSRATAGQKPAPAQGLGVAERNRPMIAPRQPSASGPDRSAVFSSDEHREAKAPKSSVNRQSQNIATLGCQVDRSNRSTSNKTHQSTEDRRMKKRGNQNLDNPSHLIAAKAKEAPSKVGEPHLELAPTVKPAFDVPISAVNAGERRVAVKYHKSVISVPITPSTTAMDLVREAGQQLGVPLDSHETLVLESFRRLGLERPLRKYEYIRSVLNSWDFDAQNALILTGNTNFGTKDALDVESVHERHTEDVSTTMYHSQRPRHWDKETLTLRSDGQILIIKKGVSTNVCHLSDFDIYIPSKGQLSKSIRPPKKICFAIKSQQKSSMFLSTENFVHFLCTKDQESAKLWYAAVQSWRSWYLINVMGQGLSRNLPEAKFSNMQSGALSGTMSGAKATRIDQSSENPGHLRHGGSLSGTRPLASAKDSSTVHSLESRKPYNADIYKKPFSTTGLLGRTYTQRKKVQEEQMEKSVNRDGRGVHLSLGQSGSVKLPGAVYAAPLIDLTPHYQEPPQHRRGKGVTPAIMPAGGLVEVATTPELAIPLPPATSWKRHDTNVNSFERSGTIRNRSQQRPSNNIGETLEVRPSVYGATMTGLINTDTPSQGDLGHGRGVQTGDRNAKSPLMDIHEGSRYAPGSLLASVDLYDGRERKPAIDRERTKEVRVDVGET